MFCSSLTHFATLEKKLYQIIISRLDGEKIPLSSFQEKIFELVQKGIGGFIIFGGAKDEVRNFTDKIQSISSIPLFIASDIERGVGQQIQDNTIFPCQMAMAAAVNRNTDEDIFFLRNVIRAMADEAKDVGINMPLIPVLDVNQDPDNPIICTRAFSDEPEDVAWFGAEYIEILENSGLISCAKHFPGHGDTSTDSHISLPVITKSYDDLMHIDLIPFKKAIHAGVSSIMIGHLSIPAIDRKPASLSKEIVTHLLREELGYNGLVITDALNMHALKETNNIYSQCIKAGVDILLHPHDPDAAVGELLSAAESGEISEKSIETALRRIFIAKEKLFRTETRAVDYQKNAILSSQMSDMSISLFKNTPGILPVSDKDRVQVILAGDRELFKSTLFKDSFTNTVRINDTIESLPPFKPFSKRVVGSLCTIFVLFTSVAAWKGSSGIEETHKNRIQDLIKELKSTIVVSFGSPYVLRHFRDADILIAAYDSTKQAQRAVIKCLEGRMDFKGRLPVQLGV